MHSSDFYLGAATVIPLLLIALIASRSFRPGQMRDQPVTAMLTFVLPVIGELAAFSFLFSAPVPTPAAVVLAVATWAGLLGELALAVFWGAELLRRDLMALLTPTEHGAESAEEVQPRWWGCSVPGCDYKIESVRRPPGHDIHPGSPMQPLTDGPVRAGRQPRSRPRRSPRRPEGK